MGADALGQPVVDRGDVQGALQCPESALDIGQGTVAGDDRLRFPAVQARDQQQLTVETFGSCPGLVINVVTKLLARLPQQSSGTSPVCGG